MKRRASWDATAAVLVVLLGVAVCGCGGAADDPMGNPVGSATGSDPATGGPEKSANPRPSDAGAWAGDPCALLSAPDIATVFPAGPPAPERKDYGAGFSECRWERAAVRLRVAVMPVSELTADYIDKLNVAGPVAGLGDGAVWFRGVLSIGAAATGGATVGFPAGPHGVLIAVRSGSSSTVDQDLARATALGRLVPPRLG